MPKAKPGLSDSKSLVPDSFTLAGTRWEVKREMLTGEMGHCSRDEAIIRLNNKLAGQIEESTFYHELVHAVLFSMGKTGDKHDEEFVDLFGAFLHQFMLTRGK